LVAPGLTPKGWLWPALVGRTPVLVRAKALCVATIRKTAAAMVAVVVRWNFRMFSPVLLHFLHDGSTDESWESERVCGLQADVLSSDSNAN
jgi:hypothetical protein